ncbi:MAG TPA: 23S rRNA (adenine(1618)-N(6))-methyltransferase RlmF [Opitutaceae bacterium]|nr:23S rRNA (adenine(1618)-N(6))-methyltransferase RlmF [Opitutaceae bacterium]
MGQRACSRSEGGSKLPTDNGHTHYWIRGLSAVTKIEKSGLHPRNRHAHGYDFPSLVRSSPDLQRFVRPSPAGNDTIDFAEPSAVMALNRALLKHHYGIEHWQVPPGYLCPPVPGRADYVHHVADLLAEGNGGAIPRGAGVVALDIGVGANCVYPILGVSEYGWRFVGTDIDPVALASARRIVTGNPVLAGKIDCRLQGSPGDVFASVVHPGETFAVALCNPPFHASAAEAAAGTRRKLKNLAGGKVGPAIRNFGGRNTELWCRGGEAGFVGRMIAQSAERPELCGWFTTLVSKRESLAAIYRLLKAGRATEVRTIELTQGQKKSRIVAWRFR